MMEHKGYSGAVEFDDVANIFHGEVLNLRDVITFQGRSVNELRKAFRDSVDFYLEHCAARGKEPEKPFSGKFVVRVEPTLHRAIATKAHRAQKSLNAWVQETLAEAVQEKEVSYVAAPKRKARAPRAASAPKRLKLSSSRKD